MLHNLQRWALKTSVFSYRMKNVMGELNIWTDLIRRRGVGWIAGSEHKAHGKVDSLFAQPYISRPDYDMVEFPSKKEILLVQQSAVKEHERLQQNNAMARQEAPPQHGYSGGMRMMNNALRIPERAVKLHLRFCVEAHCHSAGHRAYDGTLSAIKEYVVWTTMTKYVWGFVQTCSHCVTTIPGDKVPRPLCTQRHATKPNEILHFDFLYIGLSRDRKYQYVLLLRDDLSRYLWLMQYRTADACSAARTNVVFTNSYVDNNSCLISE
jgi:Integrase zinc binding domain